MDFVEGIVSHPSSLSPWFVIFKQHHVEPQELVWYQSSYSEAVREDGVTVETFSANKRGALLFHNLGSAARVAASENAMIRTLVTRAEAEEFER